MPRGMIVTLCSGIGVGQQHRDQRVAGLVDGGDPLLFVADDPRPALGAHEDLVLGDLEVDHGHGLLVLAGGDQRRLVDQVGEIGAGEAGRAAGQ